jgi:hypothetical protein
MFDLKMMTDAFEINFDLTDGYGTHRYTGSLATINGYTNYEKLYYLSKFDYQPKHFYWGDVAQASCKFHVMITRLSTPLGPGQKNLFLRNSLSLQVVNEY